MLALLLNHDRNLRANLTGHGASGKMKAGAGRYSDVHASGDRLQIPIAIAAWIALDCDTPSCGMGFHVAICVTHRNGSAGSVGIDAAAWIFHLYIARNGVSQDVTLGVQDRNIAGDAGGAHVIAAIFGSDGSARGRKPDLAADILSADRSR